MSIFKRLAEIIGEGYSLNLTVQMKGGKMSATVLPTLIGKDVKPEFKTMQPIVITGTPDELDVGFLAAIVQPLAIVNKLTVSGDTFVKPKKGSTKKAEEKPVVKKEEPTLDMRTDDSAAKAVETLEPTQVVEYPKSETAEAPVTEAEEAPTAAPMAAAEPEPAVEPSGEDFDASMGSDEDW